MYFTSIYHVDPHEFNGDCEGHMCDVLFSLQVQLMSECSGSIKSVKRVSMILDDEEQQEGQGLTGLSTADKQSGTDTLSDTEGREDVFVLSESFKRHFTYSWVHALTQITCTEDYLSF